MILSTCELGTIFAINYVEKSFLEVECSYDLVIRYNNHKDAKNFII